MKTEISRLARTVVACVAGTALAAGGFILATSTIIPLNHQPISSQNSVAPEPRLIPAQPAGSEEPASQPSAAVTNELTPTILPTTTPIAPSEEHLTVNTTAPVVNVDPYALQCAVGEEAIPAGETGYMCGPADAADPTLIVTPPVVTPEPTPQPSASTGGKPTESNTGVPVGVKLTPYYGNITVIKDGTVIDGLDIHGTVNIKAKNVIIKNSIIQGPDDPSVKYYALVTVNPWVSSNPDGTQYSVTIQDSELFAQHPTPSTNGIYGYNFTVLRSDIHHVVDQIHVYGNNVRVEASWLHDNVFWGPEIDKSHIDGTHADNVQIQRGTNLTFIGNNQSGSTTASYMVTADTGTISQLSVDGNWINGGGCSVNISGKTTGKIFNSQIVNNRFGPDRTFKDCHIIRPLTTPIVFSGNVVDATGEPATLRRG